MKTFTHNVTRVKDPDTGVWNELPSISGKTAYQYALDGGYTGTEEEFKAKMAAEYLTAVDLNPYAKTEELSVAITNEEINEICTDVVDGTGSIPIATKSTIGCVAVGDGLDVDKNGTVSVPHSDELDYIVEEGNNKNGNYRKWKSGILEQWVYHSAVSWPINLAYGSLYQGRYTWTYPIEFIEIPDYVVCPKAQWDTGASWATVYTHDSTSHVEFRAFDIVSRGTDYRMIFFAYAKGRWK